MSSSSSDLNVKDVVDLKVLGTCMVCSKLAEKRCTRCYTVFYCSVACQKKDWKVHKGTNCEPETEQQHFDRIVKDDQLPVRVVVKPSKVHGKGVFCTAAAPKGTRLCYYAGLDRDARVRIRMRGGDKLAIVNADEVFGSVVDSASDTDRCMAHPVNPDDKEMKVRLGAEEPEGEFGVGQFINDGARPHVDVGENFGRASQAMHRYESDSQARSNCEAKRHFWFVATRDIAEGEELFTHYGFEFWTQKLLLESKYKEERLLFYALSNQTNRPFDLRKFFKYDSATVRAFLTIMLGVKETELKDEDPVQFLMQLTPKIGIGAENITMIGKH